MFVNSWTFNACPELGPDKMLCGMSWVFEKDRFCCLRASSLVPFDTRSCPAVQVSAWHVTLINALVSFPSLGTKPFDCKTKTKCVLARIPLGAVHQYEAANLFNSNGFFKGKKKINQVKTNLSHEEKDFSTFPLLSVKAIPVSWTPVYLESRTPTCHSHCPEATSTFCTLLKMRSSASDLQTD